MKRVFKGALLFVPILCLISCSNQNSISNSVVSTSKEITPVYNMPKPADTDLKYWITQTITREDIHKECVQHTTCDNGAYRSFYIDPRYEPDMTPSGYNYPLDKYILYTVCNYSDLADETTAITGIEIKDPSIRVYGLTCSASKEEIDAVLVPLGYESFDNSITAKDNIDHTMVDVVWHWYIYTYENIQIEFFNDDFIEISAEVSNKTGLKNR